MQGKRVLSELDFVTDVMPRSTKIVAVTGTNGKATIATFVGHVYILFLFEFPFSLALGVLSEPTTFSM